MLLDFEPFEVTVRPNLRHWEDPDTGFEVFSNGKPGVVQLKNFRSKNLRDALLKNHLLITKGKCTFAYRGAFMTIEGGKDENRYVIHDVHNKEIKLEGEHIEKPKVEEKVEKSKVEKKVEDVLGSDFEPTEATDDIPLYKPTKSKK